MKFTKLLLVSVFLVAFNPTRAQDVDNNRRLTIILRDGTVYHGTMVYDDGREMKFNTDEIGLFVLKKNELRRLEEIKAESPQDTESFIPVIKEGPFSTRYGLTTNAFPIKKGENYAMVGLHGPELHFAVTDRLNVGYMTTWAASPMAISLKYSLPLSNQGVAVSVGSLLLSSGFFQNMKGYGTLTFGNLTLGDRNKNINFSGGYLYWQSGRKTIAPDTYVVSYEDWWGNGQNQYIKNLNNYGQYYLSLREDSGGLNGDGIRSGIYNYSGEEITSKVRRGYATQGPVLGVSGTLPLGDKASFVFESMFGFLVVRKELIEVPVYNNNSVYHGGSYYTHYYDVKVTAKDYGSTMIYVAPGVRFQTKEDFAWQLTLASTSFTSDYRNKTTSFPVPTFTLFKKF
jgi:hypothetical protein